MTMTSSEHDPWEQVSRFVTLGDARGREDYLDQLPGSEIARALSHLSDEQQREVLMLLSPTDAAEVLEEIPHSQAADLVVHLPAQDAATIVQELPSDEKADILGAVDDQSADAILAAMEPEAAEELRTLVDYPPDVAGGLMVTEVLRFFESATVGQVVTRLQSEGERFVDYEIQYSYVTSQQGTLVGVLRLRNLLLASAVTGISKVMIPSPLFVRDMDSLDELSEFFERHDFLGAPVVDAEYQLLGVVKRHDVEAAIADRSDSDYLKSQGIVGGEELRSMPVVRRCRRRLAWLSVNILLNILAASVIAAYQDTLSAVIALAVFLPIISDMSGCSGNQAVAVSIRELSLGLVEPREILRVWGKELVVGVINGVALGTIIAGSAWLWKGNLYLGIVVGLALALNTVVSVSIGGTIPLVLKRFGVDPALASGPVLTTVTDVCGFLLVLGFATLALSRLVA
jgi:magnesium transporter